MKKLAITFAIIAAIAAVDAFAQEQYAWPGWKCRDVAVLEHQLTLVDAAPTPAMKTYLAYMLDFARNGEPASLAEAWPRIEAAARSVDPKISDDKVLSLVKQYARNNGVYLDEAIAFCLAHPNSYDYYMALEDKTEWGWETVANCLMEHPYSPDVVLRGVDYLNRQAIALDKSDEETLALLKKLNRVFSALLVKDKEAWGKVVAQIRTIMDAYK